MNRAERRRLERAAEKDRKRTAQETRQVEAARDNAADMEMTEVARLCNVRISLIKDYLSARNDEMMEECRDLLYRAEDYITIINVLAFLYAINRTWHFTTSLSKVLENYNEALDKVDSMGAVEAYRYAHEHWGITMEFEDFDVWEKLKFIDESNAEEKGGGNGGREEKR